MARRRNNKLPESAAWFIAVFGALFVAGAGYLILKTLEENHKKELIARSERMKEQFKSLKDRRTDRIKEEILEDEARKKAKEQKGIQGRPIIEAPWSYDGEKAPHEWANLSSDYVLCAHGKKQSPIDLVDATPSPSLPSVVFKYKSQELNMANNGKALYIKIDETDNYIKFKRRKYTLKEITFHTPSEHYLDSAPYDMEIQFHHQNEALDFVNVSVFVDAMGGTNKLLKKLWNDLPHSSNLKGTSIRFNPSELLPINRRYFTYDGSMSIPPCSENTKWIIFKEPIRMSIRQLDKFRTIFRQNTRPIQRKYGQNLKISKVY